ncbi:MAG TPA: beta-carotene hydroxylase [Bacteroidales bacterium]|jgi:beta-carotene 3-hydroxylase|nr:beta-carotene hydroxylase [Bacteroidales bacterium]
MSLFWLILVGFGAFLFMEFMAWFTHKYVMHGFLWVLHKDHHAPQRKVFERNDFFAVIFAVPSFLGIYLGLLNSQPVVLALGIGIATYGVSYFLFHDILYHQRLKIFGDNMHWYFRSIVKAHFDHHRGKKNYGFLFMVPLRYIQDGYKQRKETQSKS